MAFAQSSGYTKTYTSFSGADIKATFGNILIGELQAITYSVTREKSPIYTMGDPNPRSFSRGKRGIAGSLVFTVFDRDSLHEVKEQSKVYRQGLNQTAWNPNSKNELYAVHEEESFGAERNISAWQNASKPAYTDEVPPFDISISFMNEYGQSSQMRIYGVEILNEGMGMSIDDITTEKSCTFVARGLEDMAQDAYETR